MSKRWLYKVLEIKPNAWGVVKAENIQAELDRLGVQGWELVSVVMQPNSLSKPFAVLKKEA